MLLKATLVFEGAGSGSGSVICVILCLLSLQVQMSAVKRAGPAPCGQRKKKSLQSHLIVDMCC